MKRTPEQNLDFAAAIGSGLFLAILFIWAVLLIFG